MGIITVRTTIEKQDGLLVDVNGVLLNGGALIKGADEALEKAYKAGKKIVILSNESCRGTELEKKLKLQRLIKGVHYHEVVTTGDVFFDHIKETPETQKEKKKVYVVGIVPEDHFAGTDLEITTNPLEADSIYIGLPGTPKSNEIPSGAYAEVNGKDYYAITSISPFEEELKNLCSSLKKEGKTPSILLVNPDENGDETLTSDGKTKVNVIREGTLANYIRENADCSIIEFGKPNTICYKYAEQVLIDQVT